MDINTLKEVILEQGEAIKKKIIIERENIEDYSNNELITIITGIRRCGKSTLLHQIQAKNKEKDYYLNFDDERLVDFSVSDFQLLYEIFIELYGKQSTFYFDEIQNIDKWERFVRRLYDSGNKIYITGSNASMLSRELGTHLTGRYIQNELFPFSFSEYLKFKNIKIDDKTIYTTEGKATLKREYVNYTKQGGFPEYIKNKTPQYLKTLYENILYRDVLVRNKLLNEKELRELVHYIASNITKPASYSSLSKIINVKHTQTVKQYLQYLQNTYLIFLVNRYDYSLKKQLYNPKKIYFIDNALANIIGFTFTEDKGRFLENIVFLELKRRGLEIFYHQVKKECDFVIKEKMKITAAIQVTSSLNIKNNKEREINGLLEAMEIHNLAEGLIITENEQEEIKIKGKIIKVVPIYKWLLGKQ